MQTRVKSLKRVVAVQTQMVRLAEWRLASKQQQLASAEEAQRKLREVVASDTPLGPMLTAAAFRGLSAIQRHVSRHQEEVVEQSRDAGKTRRRELLARRILEDATAEMARAREADELQETVEVFLRHSSKQACGKPD